jgi:hypothetical protein
MKVGAWAGSLMLLLPTRMPPAVGWLGAGLQVQCHPTEGLTTVADWASAIRVAALDCAEEKNQEVCRTYNIHFYPTFRVSRQSPL